MNAKTAKRQIIKMVSWNPTSRVWGEIFPEDAVSADKMVAMYWSRDTEKYVTCPDCPLENVYSEWLAQIAN